LTEIPLTTVLLKFPRLTIDGYSNFELTYAAEQLGIYLIPFREYNIWVENTIIQKQAFEMFDHVVSKYDGILIGLEEGQTVGHAIYKKNGKFFDEEKEVSTINLTNRIFHGWVNKEEYETSRNGGWQVLQRQ